MELVGNWCISKLLFPSQYMYESKHSRFMDSWFGLFLFMILCVFLFLTYNLEIYLSFTKRLCVYYSVANEGRRKLS
jgi:hypothetical protein